MDHKLAAIFKFLTWAGGLVTIAIFFFSIIWGGDKREMITTVSAIAGAITVVVFFAWRHFKERASRMKEENHIQYIAPWLVTAFSWITNLCWFGTVVLTFIALSINLEKGFVTALLIAIATGVVCTIVTLLPRQAWKYWKGKVPPEKWGFNDRFPPKTQ